jgi:hypothetical protein
LIPRTKGATHGIIDPDLAIDNTPETDPADEWQGRPIAHVAWSCSTRAVKAIETYLAFRPNSDPEAKLFSLSKDDYDTRWQNARARVGSKDLRIRDHLLFQNEGIQSQLGQEGTPFSLQVGWYGQGDGRFPVAFGGPVLAFDDLVLSHGRSPISRPIIRTASVFSFERRGRRFHADGATIPRPARLRNSFKTPLES